MAKFCTNCGSAMEDDRTTCPVCGNPVENTPFNNNFVQSSSSQGLEEPMTIGNWIITLLLSYIPIVGFILLIVWAINAPNTSKRNYARANLIFAAIVYVIVILSACGSAMLIGSRMYY